MKNVTVSLLNECISGRRMAMNCTRCGGTGLFRSIQKYEGLASSHGKECFSCSKYRKLPLRWTMATNYDKAGFIASDLLAQGCLNIIVVNKLLDDLVDTGVLTQDDSKIIFDIIHALIRS